MLVYYFPDKKGPVYVAPIKENMVLMDVTVVGTEGLVSLVEERCGLHHQDVSFNRRMCCWYEIMKPWLESHPDNILYRSFKLNQLSMAKQMLTWRDELKMAGWDFSFEDENSRLGALAAIEREFKYPGLADRVIKLLREIEKTKEESFSDIEISLPYDKSFLPGLLSELLKAMEEKGAKLVTNRKAEFRDNNLQKICDLLMEEDGKKEIELDTKDNSFRILKFSTKKEEEEYLAIDSSKKDALWILSNNKSFDNRLESFGQPATGSDVTTRSRITGLLKLLISLYCRPLDIRNIMEWLSSPFHPLPAKFRYALAEKVASSGGYMNQGCKDTIKAYIEGYYESAKSEEELQELRTKMKIKARRNEVECFLPYYYGRNSLEDLKKSLEALSSWATKYMHHLRDSADRDAFMRQFNALIDGVANLEMLMLEDIDSLTSEVLLKWSDEVISEVSLQQYPAMVGSQFVVRSPGDIANPVKDTIWMELEGMVTPKSECDFLFPGEREAIRSHAKFNSPEMESKARYILDITPFLMTENSLLITFAGKDAAEDIVSHPLLLRLKSQIKNLSEIIEEINIKSIQSKKIGKIENRIFKPEFKISDTSKIQWPKVMSASSLTNVIYDPFDFFFQRILGLQPAGMANLPSLEPTKGTVAHAVISNLFTKSRNEDISPRRILETEFDKLFDIAIEENGALLYLPENLIDTTIFRLQLHECMENLIDIIDTNRLKVIECEGFRKKYIGITKGDDEGNDLNGFIDMLLEDENGNDVIFDFKWSNGWYYRKLLDQDRSIQLAIYSELLKEKGNDNEATTAYYFMPKGELVTRNNNFRGDNVIVVGSSSSGDLIQKIKNSYFYRRRQINSGILEAFDGGPLEKLRYFIDTELQDLLPLVSPDEETKNKNVNSFSNYGLFKGL